MPAIRVIVAATTYDLQARGIMAAVLAEPADVMTLVGGGVIAPDAVEALLDELPPSEPCAIILVLGPDEKSIDTASRWLDASDNLALLHIVVGGDTLEIAARNVSMETLLQTVQTLVGGGGDGPAGIDPPRRIGADDGKILQLPRPQSPLLNAAIDWIHAVLRAAVSRIVQTGPDGSTSVTLVAVIDYLDERAARTRLLDADAAVAAADTALTEILAITGDAEPLAIVARALDLDMTEFRMLVLALAPELDPRYQRWISLLMDDVSRRVGSIGLFAELLNETSQLSTALAASGRLARWRIFDAAGGIIPAADEALRIDPPLRTWLLGGESGLANDPMLRAILRTAAWPGADLIDGIGAPPGGENLMARLERGKPSWLILVGDGGANWRARIEDNAARSGLAPLRVELDRLHGMNRATIEDSAMRLARLARISGQPLVLDAGGQESGPDDEDGLRLFFATLAKGRRPAAIITAEPARIVRLLGRASYEIESEIVSVQTRTEALRYAAQTVGAYFSEEAAESLANLYPLQIGGLEQAARLARARPVAAGDQEARRARFITACKEISAEGGSGLAQRIEPVFGLDDIILPPDRKSQLEEIIGNIRFAPKVLEGWRFRDQLPYGLGVTALFHGPSGTGKTMAAMAVAHGLGVQILRIDLSRIVSKYIGDTEKNIDRVFQEAQLSGSALLIDEADGLLSRRGEVKDAHDRHANLEVAYLLQRMESYEGLAILTTNLRQNLDPAFLRRLRFIIDFPRPDAAAREAIWRNCLPEEAHVLTDAMFRQLARKIELTGGSIRQITLRAAFIAAASDTKVGPEQIAQACRAEFAKFGIPPVELDFGAERRAA